MVSRRRQNVYIYIYIIRSCTKSQNKYTFLKKNTNIRDYKFHKVPKGSHGGRTPVLKAKGPQAGNDMGGQLLCIGRVRDY